MKKMLTKSLMSLCMFIATIVPVVAQTNCPTPAPQTVTNITTSSAQLNWTVPAPAPMLFNVQYRLPGAANWTQVVSQQMLYNLGNLNCNTTYEWRVQSVCANSGASTTSPFSATSTFTTLSCSTNCATPTGLTVTNATTNSVVIAWNTSPGSPVGYNLRYRASNGTSWTNISNANSPYQLGGLQCNTVYEVQVQAICPSSTGAANLSPWSASVSFTTLPCTSTCPAPTSLTSTNITATSANLSWSAVAGAFSYTVRYRPTGTTTWVYSTATTNSKNLTGLLCNTPYEWRVRANCNNSSANPYSAFATFTTLVCPTTCPTPTGLSSTNITASSATVSWTAVTGAFSYTVRYRPVGSLAWLYMNTTTASANLANLVCNTGYEWRVRSNCTPGANTGSAYSAFANFTTATCPTSACGVPNGLGATGITQTGALLGWNAVTGALSYNIRYRSMNSATWLTTTSNTNSKQIGNLSPGTPHEFQVQAVCAGTNGAVVTSAFSQSYIFTTMTILNLYPNPGGNMVKLSAGSDSDETAVVEIRDMFGNLVYQSQMRLHSGVNEQDVNTSMLKDGMYSVTMHTNSAVHSTRLVIRH